MAKAPESAGSDPTELKTLLKLAHSKPVNVAFGLGGDGKVVIKLDKMKNPKALAKTLKDGDPKIKNLLVGQVSIDPDDASTATFSMNKEAGGIEGKLIVALKGTGVSKVHISVDAGASGDDEEGAGDAPEGAPDAAPQAATAAPPATAATAPSAAPAADTPAAPTAAALTAQLTGLVKQMMAAIASNPAQKVTLAQLATSAQASLKQGNLAEAATEIASLQQALGGAASATPAAPPAAPASPPAPASPSAAPPAAGAGATDPAMVQKLKKSQLIWTATRTKIDADLQKLTKAVLDASKGEAVAEGLEQQFNSAVQPVLAELDESLSDTLSKAAAATDPGEHQKLMAQVHMTLERYQKFVQGSAIISHLDSNPFVPLTISKTLAATLTALSSAVQ